MSGTARSFRVLFLRPKAFDVMTPHRLRSSGRSRLVEGTCETRSSHTTGSGSTSRRREPPRRRAPRLPSLPVRNPGSASASANAFAVSKRSAGSFSSAFATAAATFGGTDLRTSATGRATSAMIFTMICCAEEPVCGGSPASISYSMLASEYTSLRPVILLARSRLLRTHVVGRPQRHPGLGHASAGRGAQGQRDAEVRHHGTAVVEQDVLRLDVPVDHPCRCA